MIKVRNIEWDARKGAWTDTKEHPLDQVDPLGRGTDNTFLQRRKSVEVRREEK